ncbi:MAG: hypothetical protein DMD65_08160 [Gemmatimonadetes bacterium]|nr:MAG: hypothetical protein DMD65_08160 [Gemmatimonadota bacterium]
MRRGVSLGLTLLRATALGTLVLLLWNPAVSRVESGVATPLVLLDASLSMAGQGGGWRAALDTARALAHGGVIWRFGARVTAFDTLPPADGASRLGPALAAAAARGGPVVVVTDGAITDAADLPPDLARGPRIVVVPRGPFFDAFVASVDGPRHVSAGDTIRLSVSYGTAGPKEAGRGKREGTLIVNLSGRRIASHRVVLPDSGVVSTDISLPASLFAPGASALEVRLEGASDSEPRDDARTFVLDVSPQPSVVLLAAPPDWETRFLARTLTDVARVPLRAFVAAEPGGSTPWRDGATLAAVAAPEVARAVAAARLVIEAGEPATLARFVPPHKGAVLLWPAARRQEGGGDWYVQPPGPSPLAAALAGAAWDSLPPVTGLVELAPDSAAVVVLTARLGRRGAPRPLVVLSERDGRRRAVVAGAGLYRWAFRGGASAEAYRALMAGLVDWLLAEGAGSRERFVPVTYEVPNGLPLVWRWTGAGAPQDAALSLWEGGRERRDTLRFDAGGRAELRLAPGVYRYAAAAPPSAGGGERGLVAVEMYSDEWRPAGPALAPQAGLPAVRVVSGGLRDRWWLFVLAVVALTAEWAWRRRQGLP